MNAPDVKAILSRIPPAPQVTLVLPFTHCELDQPEPLLPTIFHTLVALPSQRFHVHFSTPSSNIKAESQLYDVLRQGPRAHWKKLQAFLSKVYATLSAAQWECGKIGLDVEVEFQSGRGKSEHSGTGGDDRLFIVLEGYEDLLPATFKSHNDIRTIPKPPSASNSITSNPLTLTTSVSPGPAVVALGGTFDHLHAAHKLLLHLAHFLASRKIIVGVMSDSLLSSKSHRNLVQPLSVRISAVTEFMDRLNSALPSVEEVELDILEIHDAYGPTRDERDIQALVISDETRSGGEAVNKLRRENGLGELEVWCIDVISGTTVALKETKGGGVGSEGAGEGGILKGLDEKTLKEVKMGSTGIRSWLAEQQKKQKGGRDIGCAG